MTSCGIIHQHRSGAWRVAHCWYDGFLSGAGMYLLKSYDDDERVEALIDIGGLDFVEQDLLEIRDTSPHTPSIFATREDALREALTHDYAYLWEEGRWSYNIRWKLVDRHEYLMMFSPLRFRDIIEEDDDMVHVADPILRFSSLGEHMEATLEKLRLHAERSAGVKFDPKTLSVTYEA